MKRISKLIRDLIITDPYYGIFLSKLNKRFVDKEECPTAGVRIAGLHVELVINEDFFFNLTLPQQKAILKHETMHIVFGHLLDYWEALDHELANIAMDCEINSSLTDLPEGCMHPDLFGFNLYQGTKWYYDALNKKFPPQDVSELSPEELEAAIKEGRVKIKEGKEFGGTATSLTPEQAKVVDSLIKEKIKETAKATGQIPSELKKRISDLIVADTEVIKWQTLFKRMIGFAHSDKIKKSRKKENVRFIEAPGIKRKRKVNLLVAIDTSGSIKNKDYQEFMAELNKLYKQDVHIHVLECDSQISREYDFNGKWDSVTGGGGTSFEPPINYYITHRKQYNTLIYLTDGCATCPDNTPKNMIWLITTNGTDQYIKKGLIIKIKRK